MKVQFIHYSTSEILHETVGSVPEVGETVTIIRHPRKLAYPFASVRERLDFTVRHRTWLLGIEGDICQVSLDDGKREQARSVCD